MESVFKSFRPVGDAAEEPYGAFLDRVRGVSYYIYALVSPLSLA